MNPTESSIAAKEIDRQHANHTGSRAGMRRGAAGVFFAMAAVFALGCGATRPSKYYQLALPNDLSPSKTIDPLPITLILGRLKASHLYREDRIVFSSKGEEMGAYQYQRWAEPPTEMMEEMLLRELRASGRYQSVYFLSSTAHGDFLLRGRLYDFKEISGGPILARVTLDLELVEMKTGSTMWTHYYTHDEPVGSKDVAAVVAALNRNVQQGVNEVSASLDQYFASHSPK